jgi:hypothetical protein
LSYREPNNELLPWEQGSVKETGEALEWVSYVLEALNWFVPEEYPSCQPAKECVDEECEMDEPRCFQRKEFD